MTDHLALSPMAEHASCMICSEWSKKIMQVYKNLYFLFLYNNYVKLLLLLLFQKEISKYKYKV